MSEYVINHVPGMIELAGKTVDKFGLDDTRSITYTFNQQGFRSSKDYNDVPKYAFFGCSLVFGIGVPEHQIFANMFNNSHNYGIAGSYTNKDVFTIIQEFEKVYSHSTINKVVCWTNRNSNWLTEYSPLLADKNFIQFFCSDALPYKNCFRMMPDVDNDVSQTHMGTKSHKNMYKLLCALFNR